MRASRSEKVKAGIFVIVTTLLFVTILVVVAGLRLFRNEREYVIRFDESVTGLETSSTVRYRGVSIGRVRSIGFAEGAFPKIDVVIEVDANAPVKADTKAVLKPQGITGLYYIDLEGGSPDAPPHPSDVPIVADESLTVKIVEGLSKFGDAVEKIDRFLADNRGAVSDAVGRISTAASDAGALFRKLDGRLDDLSSITTTVRDDIGRTMNTANEVLIEARDFLRSPAIQAVPGKLDSFLTEADGLLADLRSKVGEADIKGAFLRVEDFMERAGRLEREVARAVASLNDTVAENRGPVMRAAADIREFARNLKQISREVRDQPSRLFFDRPEAAREQKR